MGGFCLRGFGFFFVLGQGFFGFVFYESCFLDASLLFIEAFFPNVPFW